MPEGQFDIGHPEPNAYSDHWFVHSRAVTLTPPSREAVAEYLPTAEPSLHDRCVSRARRQGHNLHHS